ncbi:Uncharacterised protein [Burkholderia pseudomallei]|nr:Uncharacterised protein [Burkholderia pseudomallei]
MSTGLPWYAVTDAVLTMRAPAFMCVSAACVQKNIAKILVRNVCVSCASLICPMSVCTCCSPALFTSTSRRPKRSTARLSATCAFARSPMSSAIVSQRRPVCSIRCFVCAASSDSFR